jgi:hypothetical protein
MPQKLDRQPVLSASARNVVAIVFYRQYSQEFVNAGECEAWPRNRFGLSGIGLIVCCVAQWEIDELQAETK